MHNLRRIPLENTENARDLGGYPIKGTSRMTRYNKFFRTGVPSQLNPSEEAQLKRLGLTTVIDLRSSAETARTACYFQNRPGFSYHHLHLDGGERVLTEGKDRMGLSYLTMCKSPAAGEIFRILAQARGSCLFHCTAGKDRTGTVAAVLLSLAGVDVPDIVADYSISYPYLANTIRNLQADYPDLPAYLGRSDPENMEDFLMRFRQEYGSAEQYLKGLGLSSQALEALKAKLICEADV